MFHEPSLSLSRYYRLLYFYLVLTLSWSFEGAQGRGKLSSRDVLLGWRSVRLERLACILLLFLLLLILLLNQKAVLLRCMIIIYANNDTNGNIGNDVLDLNVDIDTIQHGH